MSTLLLASASPARAATLRAAGVEPLIRVADVDEDAILAEHARSRPAGQPAATVAEAVLILARAKAEHVARASAGATTADRPDVILGCDSLLDLDGRALGKPGTAERAVRRWHRMRGRTGVLHTGHWLVGSDGRSVGKVSSTTVHFADITDAEIEAYVGTGEPLRVAGAFTIDGRGAAFITGIEGDHHGVVGISLPLLRTMLAELGLTWTDFWA
ncbi:Maf family protein [Occultella gossypii]|uniref:Nucleoside triphosphate pyrophosphatase n=1 Tax=Occultella gossypii TaxID=2800820 RepID=A0ABS7S836_9MICO|nr:Maf family protein [Occultella gossypii]MBZ2196514.1 septum formation inhibitor Maf [Occultella gossypii]